MADCTALARLVSSWGGSVVPARVLWVDDGWAKTSIKGWPARASSDPERWSDGWFTWGGEWWVALCPRVNGLIALDCDGPEAVDVFRAATTSGRLEWDAQLAYYTPGHGGGLHVVWRWPDTIPTMSRKVVTLPGGGQVDLRGEGTFLLLAGAPRPDLPNGAGYSLVTNPGDAGPAYAPDGLIDWMLSLGALAHQDAPSIGGGQVSPEWVEKESMRQGGRVRVDRHTVLFRLASWARVRKEYNTFELLANFLWNVVEDKFEFDEEERDHWMRESIRVARNAWKYTQERDQAQQQAARAWMSSWNPQ